MIRIRTLLGLIVLGLVVALGSTAFAQTPDEETPAEEIICEGLEGAAFGLCNAYCEAQDCNPFDSTKSCSQVLNNYQKNTGYPGPSCACGQVCLIEGVECAESCEEDCSSLPTTQQRIQCRIRVSSCKAECAKDGLACAKDCLDQAKDQFCNLHPDKCDHDD